MYETGLKAGNTVLGTVEAPLSAKMDRAISEARDTLDHLKGIRGRLFGWPPESAVKEAGTLTMVREETFETNLSELHLIIGRMASIAAEINARI